MVTTMLSHMPPSRSGVGVSPAMPEVVSSNPVAGDGNFSLFLFSSYANGYKEKPFFDFFFL